MDTLITPKKLGRPRGNKKELQNFQKIKDAKAYSRTEIMQVLGVCYNRAGRYMKMLKEEANKENQKITPENVGQTAAGQTAAEPETTISR